MADVIEVPSIWDYLGQGIQAGADAYNKRKADQKDTEDKQVTFMTQLLNAGLIDQKDFNNAIQGTRFNQIKARPSKTEQSEQLAATGVSPVTGKPATANEFQRLDLLTPGQQTKDVATGAEATTQINANDVKQRYLAGDQISDREAAAIGVQTDEDIDLAKIGKNHTMLVQKAPGYVDQVLAPLMQMNNGRIPIRGWEDAINQAAEQYNQLRVQSQLPADPSAKAYMHSLVIERLIAQRTQDIEQMKAQNVGMNRMSPVDRMFQAMTGVVESRRKILDDMLTNNTLLGLKLNNPNTQKDPDVIRYRAVEQSMLNAQNAQAKLAQGIVPSDVGTYLQVDPTEAPNTTGKQIVGPGAPGGQVRDDIVKQLSDGIKGKRYTLEDVKAGIGRKITQEEFDAIATAVQANEKQANSNRRMGPR